MGARFRSWWQQIKKHRVAIGVVAIVLVVAITLIIVGYWFDWTGFNGYNKITVVHTISGTNAGTVMRTEEYQPGKSLWDWLQLFGILAIPAVVGLGTVWFTSRQTQASEANRAQQAKESDANRERRHKTDLEIAEENRKSQQQTQREIAHESMQDAALQVYLEKMSDLLLRAAERVSGAGKVDSLRIIGGQDLIQARTLTILRGLDARHKGSVLQFLHECGLIRRNARVVDLSEADLRGTNLIFANLSNADLKHVHLECADLSGANLDGADVEDADLSDANLQGAKVTDEQLAKVKSLQGATLPDGSIHP